MIEHLRPLAKREASSSIDAQTEALQQITRRKIFALTCHFPCDQQHQHYMAVLDMDGTLYPHDGPQNGFRGSTKERLLVECHLRYIQSKEPSLSDRQRRELFEHSLACPIGPSTFLATRYGCARETVLTEIWSQLDPNAFIQKEGGASLRPLLQDIRARTCAMLLVTSAPALWKDAVLQHLGIENDVFDLALTTEDFSSKQDVFRALSEIHPAVKGVSVGDTLTTDIIPAMAVGFHTLHMNGENTLSDIFAILQQEHV